MGTFHDSDFAASNELQSACLASDSTPCDDKRQQRVDNRTAVNSAVKTSTADVSRQRLSVTIGSYATRNDNIRTMSV